MDIRLLNARISFANGLWTASSAVAGGVPKFNCDYIVTPETIAQYRDATGKWIAAPLKDIETLVAKEAHDGNAAKAATWLGRLDARQRSIREGDRNVDKAGEIRPGYEGCLYIHATSKARMPVLRRDRSEVTDAADSPVYSGCYVNARVSLYCNLKPGQTGLFAGLQGTQFSKDGDSFGGGTKADVDDFDDIADGADSSDFA